MGWTAKDWEALRALEGLGMVLVPTCSVDHQAEWAGCSKPGKVPVDLRTGRHMRDWTGQHAALRGTDLRTLEAAQAARERAGRAPLGVGVLTGRSLKDGRVLLALDVDGDAGIAEVRRLLGPSPERTLGYYTGSGGWRLLYACAPDRVPREARTDGGHEGLALLAAGRQVVVPPSGHASGQPYRWREPITWRILDLPDAVREWAEGHAREAAPRPLRSKSVRAPVPVADAAKVDRELRLRGVPAPLRASLTRPCPAGDRSGHCYSLTARLIAYRVPDALLTQAVRVPEWGYGEAYRTANRDQGGWWESTLATVHQRRDAERAAHRREAERDDGLGR